MIKAQGYERIPEAEVKSNQFIQDILDFGSVTMLGHLAEDRLIKEFQSYELFDDCKVFKLIRGDVAYYKFQVEITNDIKLIKATILVLTYLHTRQEFLEDYRYEIVKCPKKKKPSANAP